MGHSLFTTLLYTVFVCILWLQPFLSSCVVCLFVFFLFHIKYEVFLCSTLFGITDNRIFFFFFLRYEGIVLFVCAYLDPQSCYICLGQPNGLICMILLKWCKIKTLTARALFFFTRQRRICLLKNTFALSP